MRSDNPFNCSFVPAIRGAPGQRGWSPLARLSPREIRRERDRSRCLIADIAPAIKPRMCRKCGTDRERTACDKLRANAERIASSLLPLHPSHRRAHDALAGLAPRSSCSARSPPPPALALRPARAGDGAACHRHAWRSRPGPPTSTIRPTPIRRRPKAANWCKACSAPSTASIPFIVKGLPAVNIRSYVIESLLARGYDEPFTLYGLLAESVETDAARSLVTFTHQSGRALFRRQAGDARRCDLLLAVAARPRPAEFRHLLRQGAPRPKSSASAACASISPAPTTANCR